MEELVRQYIQEGDASGVERLFREHPKLLAGRTSSGRTWLHYAVWKGTPEVVRSLYALGLPLNTLDESGECPLSAAARHGDVELVGWMLENGADPCISYWPMIDAVSTGSLEIVELFVQRGADHRFVFGDPPRTLLSQTLDYGHEEVATFLRSLDSDPQEAAPIAPPSQPAPGLGDFALGAASVESADVELGERLSFADLILQSDLAAIEQRLAARPELLHARAFPMSETWLHYAASEGNVELVRFFFGRGIPLNTTNECEECPLSAAVGNGEAETVRWMLENGADPKLGHSPMISAVSKGSLELVKTFVERGADYNFTFGLPPRTPLSQATAFGHREVADYLRSLGASEADNAPTCPDGFDLHEEIKEYFAYHLECPPLPLGLQEIVPGKVAVSVWTIDPANGRDPKVIFTSGMSAAPLTVPDGCEEYEYCELVMYLPPDWPVSPDLNDSSQSWPWIWLRKIAHHTHDAETWLGDWTTTFSNDEPPQPLDPSTKFTGFVLATNMAPLKGFPSDDGRFVNIVNIVPVYAEELELARQENGTVELLKRFQKRGIGASLRPNRLNVAVETGFLKGLFGRRGT